MIAKVYYELIVKKGKKTIDDVPARYREAVEALIEADAEATETENESESTSDED